MARTALDVVTAYIEQIWNAGRDELIVELCADPIVRHDPNAVTRLTHAEQRARIRHNYDDLQTRFTWEVLAGDDRHVTLVWNVTGRDPAWRLCGIEVFRVTDGRISDVWNLPYAHGRWGQHKTLSGRVGDGAAAAFPIMSVALEDGGARVTVPVDAVHIGRWLERLFGAPAISDGAHRYGGDPGPLAPLTLAIAEGDAATVMHAAEVTGMAIGLAETGLVNAEVTIGGSAAAGDAPAVAVAPVTRLSRTFGALERGATRLGAVADGSVTFARGGAGAHGRATLRLAPGVTAEAAAGAGTLTIGWSEGAASLVFTAEATLDPAAHSFAEEGVTATYAWRARHVAATIHRADR